MTHLTKLVFSFLVDRRVSQRNLKEKKLVAPHHQRHHFVVAAVNDVISAHAAQSNLKKNESNEAKKVVRELKLVPLKKR